MAEEFYTVPESPEYNAAAIRKIQDTDPGAGPARLSTPWCSR